MSKLLISLLAVLALPTAVNAELTKEEKIETCTLFYAGQISMEAVADKFGIKEPIRSLATKKSLKRAVDNYCLYINGIEPQWN